MSRNETIVRIRAALKQRSKRRWSVTGGHGTAWGWIYVTARRKDENLTEEEAKELTSLMGLSQPVHFQGLSIPAANDYYQEFVDRAEGRPPTRIGTPYWD